MFFLLCVRRPPRYTRTEPSVPYRTLFRTAIEPCRVDDHIELMFLSRCLDTIWRDPLDEPVQAQPLPEPPAPVEVVAVPEVLPMPAQLKPVPEAEDARSEEHTSELQSLMRISYAVFCLKKKIQEQPSK